MDASRQPASSSYLARPATFKRHQPAPLAEGSLESEGNVGAPRHIGLRNVPWCDLVPLALLFLRSRGWYVYICEGTTSMK